MNRTLLWATVAAAVLVLFLLPALVADANGFLGTTNPALFSAAVWLGAATGLLLLHFAAQRFAQVISEGRPRSWGPPLKIPDSKEITGLLYVLSNPAMPGLLKIGMTTRDVHERVKELDRATGVPVPFKVIHVTTTKDPAAAERRAHRILRNYRVDNRREFFKCKPAVAIEALKRARIRPHLAERWWRSMGHPRR